MINYQKLYHFLFNQITDSIEILEDSANDRNKALEKLKQAQIDAEEMYLDLCEEEYPDGEDLGEWWEKEEELYDDEDEEEEE